MKKKIAIIGGSGFIGTRLTKRLLHSGHDIKIIDKVRSEQYPDIWVHSDIRDEKTLLESLKGFHVIYNLAAEHRDNVYPRSLYWEVNVRGSEIVCEAAEKLSISNIIFTSSVAVYGFSKQGIDETGELKPFNDYGKTKLEAEKIYETWQSKSSSRSLTIIRPTVVFGEKNRGNVYTLMHQIAQNRFIMIGNGKNIKSMVYVENVANLLEYVLKLGQGYHLFNSVDKPDMDMNTLTGFIKTQLGLNKKKYIHIYYAIGLLGGYFFDLLSLLTGRNYPISSIRIKKYCADTLFSSYNIKNIGFIPSVKIEDGIKRTIEFEFSNLM